MATPISAYGIIGDGRTAALVSDRGSIDWFCFPRFDSSSVFAAILDEERGGFFAIRPRGRFNSEQRYLDGTNVLETTFRTAGGSARLLDCLVATSEVRKRGRFWPDHEILRFVEGLEGEVPFEVVFAPRPGYGSRASTLGPRLGRGISALDGQRFLMLQTSLERDDAKFAVTPGRQVQFSLVATDQGPAVIPPLGDEARIRLRETVEYWREWSWRCRYQGRYREQVVRSALTLKLLLYAPSGAIVAAPTTSLPEEIGGERNWDYRYCWLRDASFTVRALVELGYHEEASSFVGWLLHSTRLTRPRLHVLYSVHGAPAVRERELGWLEGYGGSRPVRVGNAASEQFQLDVYGEVLDAIHRFGPELGPLDGETRRFIVGMGRSVCELWDLPDEGIWEVRSGRAHHVHSKVMAWVALDRLRSIARSQGWRVDFAHYEGEMQRMRERIENHGFSRELDSYVRVFGGHEVDGALLTLPLFGYCASTSPRMCGTLRAIREKLSRNGLIRRYAGVDDGVSGGEGSFGICSFWMAEVLARAGRVTEARQWFEAVLARGNATGLWPEELDTESGAFLGNYPQAFTHIGLINAALAIGAA